jgi:hypothetical protein
MLHESERLPPLLYMQFPLLLKSHDDHRGGGHREVNPVELIMGKRESGRRTLQLSL